MVKIHYICITKLTVTPWGVLITLCQGYALKHRPVGRRWVSHFLSGNRGFVILHKLGGENMVKSGMHITAVDRVIPRTDDRDCCGLQSRFQTNSKIFDFEF